MFPVKIRVLHLVLVGLLFIGVTATHKANALPFDPLLFGLSEGDQFRLAFVTSGTRNATSTNISDYNTFVQNEANAGSVTGGLGLTWTTIGSTALVDARDNTGTNPFLVTGVPILGLTGTRIADNNAQLWDGNIDARISFNQNGDETGTRFVWTGTGTDGTGSNLNPLGSTGGFSTLGDLVFTNSEWIIASAFPSRDALRFYAMSETITVPTSNSGTRVSEPGPLSLLGIGLIGIACLRRRRQKN